MSPRWRKMGLIAGSVMFVLSVTAAIIFLGVNLHWRYKLACSVYEGSIDCLDYAKYMEGYEWTWRGYSTTLGLAAVAGGLTYLFSTTERRRTPKAQKGLDWGAVLWITLMIAGFICLFSGYYLADNIDPLWGWQNWYVYVIIHGLQSVSWLLWIMAFGILFIMRSEWSISMSRSEESNSPSNAEEE